MIQLAAFLGNPGRNYARNRHNAGRMLAEALSLNKPLSWQKKFKGLYASCENIHFIMPETYMNLSGESVHAAASFFKIDIQKIIVIHDELELPLGTISLKFSGGLGGHNGLRSMNKCFGSEDFWRLRIGIGRPDSRLPGEGGRAASSEEGSGEGIVDWVLSNFTAVEHETLAPVLNAAADILIQTFTCEPENLLPQWAKKKILVQSVEEISQESP
jgi:PTH1 family peptidyl-tRNA hydrolase